MREKIHYAIEAALALAVIVLFVFHFTADKKSPETNMTFINEESETEIMKVAFIDTDSLLYNYSYAIDLNEQLMKYIESSQAKITAEERKWMAEAQDYQLKLENHSFLAPERQQMAEQSLMKKREDLQKMAEELNQEFSQRQFKMNETITNTIITQLKEYNKSKGYHFIYGKTADNILYANEIYNITSEVIDYLNKHYAANPSLKPAD